MKTIVCYDVENDRIVECTSGMVFHRDDIGYFHLAFYHNSFKTFIAVILGEL